MLKVFNCGQGDSMKLCFKGCYWDDLPLYIDLGPSTYRRKIRNPQFDLLITHCHDDHILGADFSRTSTMRDLYIPAYLPELRKILGKLTLRKPKIPLPPSGNVYLVHDGYQMGQCKHNSVLNPSLDPLVLFGLRKIDDNLVRRFLEQYGTSVDSILDSNDDDELNYVQKPSGYQPKLFVQAAVQRIAQKRAPTLDKAIKSFMEYDSNKLSVVFQYCNAEQRFLLTGDADVSVFKRIIKRNDQRIKCTVLKVPHHGSKKNLNQSILEYMSPKYAIFSHKNGLFGNSSDPHPNKEVLGWCRSLNIKMYFTNDVVKDARVIEHSHRGAVLDADTVIQ